MQDSKGTLLTKCWILTWIFIVIQTRMEVLWEDSIPFPFCPSFLFSLWIICFFFPFSSVPIFSLPISSFSFFLSSPVFLHSFWFILISFLLLFACFYFSFFLTSRFLFFSLWIIYLLLLFIILSLLFLCSPFKSYYTFYPIINNRSDFHIIITVMMWQCGQIQ